MEKKILYIGLASLFLILISTLALVVLVFKPSFFPLPDKSQDSLKIIKGGELDSLLKNPGSMSLDSLNYTLSTIILRRENLLLIDSANRMTNLANYYKSVKDSVSAEVLELNKTNDSLSNKISDLIKNQQTQVVKKPEKITPVFTDQEKKGFAKIYESMSPENAAKQIEQMTEIEAAKILLSIDSKQGAKILDKIEPKKAAKIWNALNSKGMK